MGENRTNKQQIMVRTLDLMITTRCNMSCKECFGHMKPYQNQDMDLDTAKKATHFYFKNRFIGDPRGNVIVLFGGEPTLRWDVVSSYLEWVEDAYPVGDFNYSTSIFTNGLNLTKDMIDFLIEHETGICISFDGPYARHIIRRNINKEDYNKIINAIKYIVNRGYGDHLLVSTVIFSDSLNYLPEYFKTYESLGVKKFQFIRDSDRSWSFDDRKRLREEVERYKIEHPDTCIFFCPEFAFNCDTCVPSTILVYPNGDVWDMCILSTSTLYRLGKISYDESRVTYFGNLATLKNLEMDVYAKRRIVRSHVFCPTLSRDWRGLLKEFGGPCTDF